MHEPANDKFINAKQAGDIYTHIKTSKRKLHKTVEAIWSN